MSGYKESPDESASPWFKEINRYLLPVCSMGNGASSVYGPRLFGELFSLLKYSDNEEQFSEVLFGLLDPNHCPCDYCEGGEEGSGIAEACSEIAEKYVDGYEKEDEDCCDDCTEVCDDCDGCAVEGEEDGYEPNPPVSLPSIGMLVRLDPEEYTVGRPYRCKPTSPAGISLRTLGS